jgi:ribosome-binding protein aMBF1 (putative translation factor)
MSDVDTVLKQTLSSISESFSARSTLGSLLREYRQTHSLQQKDLAHKLNISAAFLCYVERGHRCLGPDLIQRLLAIL